MQWDRRHFLAGSSLGLLSVTGRGAWAANGDLAYVDPELRTIAGQILKGSAGQPPASLATLAEKRRLVASWNQHPLPAPSIDRRAVPSGLDGFEVPLFLINARAGTSRPLIIYLHGGGFFSGDPLRNVSDLQQLAVDLDCVIASVGYRLAPETTYRGAMEDNYAALKWAHDHAVELGVDRRRIAVMGGSAGGGLAALLALTNRDRGAIPLVLQVLVYPALDDRTGTTIHPAPPMGTILWTGPDNSFAWRSFLGAPPGSAEVPQIAVPVRYRDLRGLPPAFIGVGTLDLFLHENLDYARRLIDAGVPTDLLTIPGAFHSFDSVSPTASATKYLNAAIRFGLKRAFTVA